MIYLFETPASHAAELLLLDFDKLNAIKHLSELSCKLMATLAESELDVKVLP